MMTHKILLNGALLAAVVFVSACGEGFVTERHSGVPYTMERTAHSGIAYVRAKMAPAAGPKVETHSEVMPATKEVVPALEGTTIPEEEVVVHDADPLFIQDSKK